MALLLPEKVAERAARFGSAGCAVTHVTLVLKSGRKVHDVAIAPGGRIVKINDEAVAKEKLTFGMTDIIDILPPPRRPD